MFKEFIDQSYVFNKVDKKGVFIYPISEYNLEGIKYLIENCSNDRPFLFGCDSCKIVTSFYEQCKSLYQDKEEMLILITADTDYRVKDANTEFVLKLLLVLTLAYPTHKTCIFTCTATLLIRLAFFNNQPDVVKFNICITSAIAHKTLVDTTPLTKLKMMSDNVLSHQKHF